MSVFQTLSLMLLFAMFILALLTYIGPLSIK
ncbi:putative holin-like toxin [Limosilactobacillus fermentum]